MKIIFAGTPDFAASALDAIIRAGHEVSLVLTQPDRASGRGMKLTPSAVKTLALSHGIPVLTPGSLSREKGGEEAASAIETMKAQEADVMVVAAYGMILSQEVLDIPKGIGPDHEFRSVNIHASLLPRWRGAAPITRAIEAGDPQTGITIMKMEAGLDTGPMIAKSVTDILDTDTTASLTERLAVQGGELIAEVLSHPETLSAEPQADEDSSYARKILKSESPVDWSASSGLICRRIRAFNPFPSCSTVIRDTTVKIWEAEPVKLTDDSAVPGTVISTSDGIVIAAAIGAIRATVLQKPGKPRMDWKPFLQSFPLTAGDVFK